MGFKGEAQEVASWPGRSSGFWDFHYVGKNLARGEQLGIGPALTWHVPRFQGPDNSSEC